MSTASKKVKFGVKNSVFLCSFLKKILIKSSKLVENNSKNNSLLVGAKEVLAYLRRVYDIEMGFDRFYFYRRKIPLSLIKIGKAQQARTITTPCLVDSWLIALYRYVETKRASKIANSILYFDQKKIAAESPVLKKLYK